MIECLKSILVWISDTFCIEKLKGLYKVENYCLCLMVKTLSTTKESQTQKITCLFRHTYFDNMEKFSWVKKVVNLKRQAYRRVQSISRQRFNFTFLDDF